MSIKKNMVLLEVHNGVATVKGQSNKIRVIIRDYDCLSTENPIEPCDYYTETIYDKP